MTVDYRVSLALAHRHLYEVEARFPLDGATQSIDLTMAVWTPGSYLIREYQRHVQELACDDGAGRPLAARKVEKATWRVSCAGAAQVVVRYRVFAHEVTVRTAHLDASHGFWNGACLYLYRAGAEATPARVTVDAPAGWHVSTALAPDPERERCFRAGGLDELIDSPFEVSPAAPITFEVLGREHRLAVWGRPAPGPFDLERLVKDLRTIIASHAALFGGLPYPRYTFLLHLVPGMHGGLEHACSTTLLESPHAFASENKYYELLELASHEFFHLWNVKRLHPAALGPFDYRRENHTRSLWVVEGWTSYYDRRAVAQTHLMPVARYLEKVSEELTKLQRTPGRLRHSLEESSFDAWIKLYRPDENSVNSTVSYYLKGSIVALLLDLEIRRRTGGARTLDHALSALWREFGEPGRGYPDEAVQPAVERASGIPLDDFFARAVRGTAELELDEPLGYVGLRAVASGADATAGWLGLHLRADGDRLLVTEAVEEGPAQHAGVHPGDQIVALDGFRVDEGQLKERTSARRPGERVRLTLFRRDELREVEVPLGEKPADKWELRPVEAPSDEQRAAFKAWLGAELPAD